MGLIQNDFERFHNHASEAITYLLRLILSMFIMLFDRLYRGCKALREYTYTVEAVYVERGIDINRSKCDSLYKIMDWYHDLPLLGNEMLKDELILSDKPAKGQVRKWKAANQNA